MNALDEEVGGENEVLSGGRAPNGSPKELHRLSGLPIEKGSGEVVYVQLPSSL